MRRALIGLCVLVLVGACGGGETPAPTTAPTDAAPTDAPVDSTPTDAPVDSTPTTTADSSPGPTQVSGLALPQFEQLEDDPAIGRIPPVVVGVDLLTGTEVRIQSEGRPIVVAFYAHWCPHCQAEVRELTEWLETNELPAGVDFVAVSVLEDATRGNHPPDQWLAEEGWQHPVIADTPTLSVTEAFGLSSVPYLVAIGPDNTVVLRYAGNVGPSQLAAFFDTLLESDA